MFVRKSELNSFKNEDPETETVTEGDPVGLKCQPPNGYPKPYVYWMIQVGGKVVILFCGRLVLKLLLKWFKLYRNINLVIGI